MTYQGWEKKQVSELRIETRSPEVSFLEMFLLSSSFNLCLILRQVIWNLDNIQIQFLSQKEIKLYRLTLQKQPVHSDYQGFAALTGRCKIQQSDLCSRNAFRGDGNAQKWRIISNHAHTICFYGHQKLIFEMVPDERRVGLSCLLKMFQFLLCIRCVFIGERISPHLNSAHVFALWPF